VDEEPTIRHSNDGHLRPRLEPPEPLLSLSHPDVGDPG
jgi:hypothetical protein